MNGSIFHSFKDILWFMNEVFVKPYFIILAILLPLVGLTELVRLVVA